MLVLNQPSFASPAFILGFLFNLPKFRQGMETLNAVDDGNIGTSILMRYTDSNREVDLEIRKLIVVMAQVFRDHKASPTPVAYLGSTCSSLDLVAASMPKPPTDLIDAHLSILSMVIPKAPAAFLLKNLDLLSNCLTRPLRSSLSPLPQTTCCLGIKCIAQLIISITKGFNNWSHVSKLYTFLLGFATMNGACVVFFLLFDSLIPFLAS